MYRVIAAIIKKDDTFLLIKKDKWEFPGGSIFPFEDDMQSLKRNIYEELGIEIFVGPYICRSYMKYKGQEIEMRAYLISHFWGDFILYDSQEIRWATKEELDSLDVHDLDMPIIESIKKMF